MINIFFNLLILAAHLIIILFWGSSANRGGVLLLYGYSMVSIGLFILLIIVNFTLCWFIDSLQLAKINSYILIFYFCSIYIHFFTLNPVNSSHNQIIVLIFNIILIVVTYAYPKLFEKDNE
jgi:hypothetical protein